MTNKENFTEVGKTSAEVLGEKFNALDFDLFINELRQTSKSNPGLRFNITANWSGVEKARSAKALLDQYASRFNIESFTIRATRQQHDEDPNAFQSGVKWEEI